MKKPLALGAVLLLVVAVAVVYFFPVLTVKNVQVDGVRNADLTAVEDATGIDPGQNMLRIDPAAAARNVSRVPWVERVTVSRAWPRSVHVDVVEHDPVGYVMDRSTPMVVDAHGAIFLSGVEPEGAVEFRGVKSDDEPAIRAAAEAVAALAPELRGQLEAVDVPNAEAVTLLFTNGKRVLWGSADRTEEKAEATRVIFGQEGDEWNVSNPAMPSVRR